ncbi:MAG: hypothetical protein U5K28_05105 [Halobacteriales archaeon]|nr:hypothetical protein [Halobacteriales archaeon]
MPLVVLAANGKLPLLGPETPFMLLLVIVVAAAVVALLIGSVSFRLSGVYFAMITLGFSQVLYVFIRDWDFVGTASLGQPRDSGIGVPGVKSLSVAIGQLTGDSPEGFLGFISLSPTEVSFYAVGAVVLVCHLLLQRLIHSPFGRVLIAIRRKRGTRPCSRLQHVRVAGLACVRDVRLLRRRCWCAIRWLLAVCYT